VSGIPTLPVLVAVHPVAAAAAPVHPVAAAAPAAAVAPARAPAVPARVGPAVIPAAAAVSAPAEVPVPPRPRGARVNPAVVGFPDVVLPSGAEGTRVAVGLLALPLLIAIWLWGALRAGSAAWRMRISKERTALAHQLGVAPTELAGVGDEGINRLAEQVAFDELTGVARRAAGMSALEHEIARARRGGIALSVAFVDVDGLKEANDTHGHEAGDRLLQAVAQVLVGRLRGSDVVFRLGGDEFVTILPATPPAVAASLMADVRERAARAGVEFSFGVAQLVDGDSSEELLARADAAQYEDKRARASERSGSG
jgi:diguanylate cyclase (GGDEF)-like protein